MKIKLIILLLIGFISVYISCKPKCKGRGEDIKRYIPDDRRMQQNKGDTLIFKTESNSFDTIIVTGIGGWFDINFYECDAGELVWREDEFFIVNFQNLDTLSLLKTVSTGQTYPGINIMMQIKGFSFSINKIGKYIYEGTTYTEVYTAESDNLILYFNRTYGILGYKINDDDMYHLFKYIANIEN